MRIGEDEHAIERHEVASSPAYRGCDDGHDKDKLQKGRAHASILLLVFSPFTQLDLQSHVDASKPDYDPVAERVLLNLLGTSALLR